MEGTVLVYGRHGKFIPATPITSIRIDLKPGHYYNEFAFAILYDVVPRQVL